MLRGRIYVFVCIEDFGYFYMESDVSIVIIVDENNVSKAYSRFVQLNQFHLIEELIVNKIKYIK